jgi:Rhodopirellula transposase DDE domain
VPLRTWETVLAFSRGTATSTGLVVHAELQHGDYPTGVKVSDAEMKALNIEYHLICPTWNYSIRPRTSVPTSSELRELVPV